MRQQVLLWTLVGQLASVVDAFYLPGAAPHDYHDGERVDLFVNALTPMIGNSDNAKLVSGENDARREKV